MEHLNAAARQRVLEVLDQGRDMTLATIRPDGYPQATTVSYIHEGLTLYVGIGLGSQKATNIEADKRISATINLACEDWNHIRGISLAATGEFVHGQEELDHIGQAFLLKFPQLANMINAEGSSLQSILFVRIRPTVISLLDYRLGFGHTELYECE
jgi:general stress protein 26